MRVCFINQHNELSGGDLSLYQLVRCLDGTEHEVHLILPKEGPHSEFYEKAAASVSYIPQDSVAIDAKRALKWLVRFPATVLSVSRALRRIQPDVVHTNSAKNLYGPIAALMLGLPHVMHVRNTFKRPRIFYQCMGTLGFLLSDRVIIVSDSVRELFMGTLSGAAKVVKIYNGVDLKQFDPGIDGRPVREELGFRRSDRVVGVISNVMRMKGQHVALEALAMVAEELPDLKMLFVGANAQALRDDVENRGLRERVCLSERRADIPQVMAACDLLLFPSLYEAFPRVVIESMAMGKPLVASRIGGVPEAVDHRENGWLVRPGSARDIADALRSLEGDPATAERLARRAREKAERIFSVERNAARTAAVYSELHST